MKGHKTASSKVTKFNKPQGKVVILAHNYFNKTYKVGIK